MRPIEQACYWLARSKTRSTTEEDLFPPLEGHREVDIAILGAGFTGLWTALFLKELAPDVEVAILEQGVAGYGASGRNAGIVGDTLDHSHALAITHFGETEAATLAKLGRRNIDEMEQFLKDRGIECDFERTGRLFAALSPEHMEACVRAEEDATRLGVTGARVLSKGEMRAEIHSPLYVGGFFEPGGGIVDPVKLVDGLGREAARLGVSIFERTRVMSLDASGTAVRASGEAGSISARKVILATNAYSHQLLPSLSARFLPLYDYILVSEPLTAAERDAIGWRNRQGVTDGRTFFNYYRLTADDRILWGTSEAVYYRGNRVDPSCDHSEPHYEALRESFRRHFPALSSLEFPYAWGGPICSTTRLTPFFGAASEGRILYGLGYTGHGIGTTRIAGQILAHMALGRHSPLLDLAMVRKKPFPYPPEPVRSWAVGTVTRSLRDVDEGGAPSLLLRVLDAMGIGFSS